MTKTLGLALVAVAAVACHPKPPAPKPVPQNVRPFDNGPTATLVDQNQEGPSYHVQIAADITRDVMPTDDLAIVVSVHDEEVGRYPVVGKFEARPTRVKQDIELPLGEYEIEFAYQGTRYAGMPFRLAEVPTWGGRRALQLRSHPGTRVSLREKKLWVGRWWANDGMPQAWIVEWVREGQVVTMTSGREDRGIPAQTSRLVAGADGAFRDPKTVNNTVWAYGEEYPVPDLVIQQPGVWAARVVHGNSPPVAVVFHVGLGGSLVELSPAKVVSAGWEASWSKPLDNVALNVTEVDRLTAKLPKISTAQPFDEPDPRAAGLEPAIRLSTAAVRALFRSKQVAELWSEYLAMNTPYVEQGQVPAAARKDRMTAQKETVKPAEKKAKLKAQRLQIEDLINKNSGPWKPDEFPRS